VDNSEENYRFVIHKVRMESPAGSVTLAPMPESKRRKPKTTGPTKSKRPVATTKPESPRWYAGVMFGLMGLGVLLVLARFIFQTEQWLLLIGLVFISAGFIMTTNYR
jgi:hypothetical protein